MVEGGELIFGDFGHEFFISNDRKKTAGLLVPDILGHQFFIVEGGIFLSINADTAAMVFIMFDISYIEAVFFKKIVG